MYKKVSSVVLSVILAISILTPAVADEIVIEDEIVVADGIAIEDEVAIENEVAVADEFVSGDGAEIIVEEDGAAYDAAEDLTAVVEVEAGEIVFDDYSMNNDELFATYVDKKFSVNDEVSEDGGTYLGNQLTGVNKTIYNKLSDKIVKVASGDLESTVFEITPEELGLKTTWAFSELSYEGKPSTITTREQLNAAGQAILASISYNINDIVNAILYDKPYEMFWYDKTRGTAFTSLTIGLSWDPSDKSITCTFPNMTYSFAVAKDYSKSLTANTYNANSTKLKSVATAVNNAKSVVETNKALADYSKLFAYKDYICNNVSYNTAAISSGWDQDKLDPWEIVYVFDEDPSTNVVCEGYSKAFQYLCELSTFKDSSLKSYLVSGTMSGGTGAGPHMWNIVRIDGSNYLVDITNCDEDSIGYPQKLFLAGSTNGNVNSGYVFLSSVAYTYDDETLSLYKNGELELSRDNYETHDFSGCTNASVKYEWDKNVSAADADDSSGVTVIRVKGTASAVCKHCQKTIVLDSYNYAVVVSKMPTCVDSGATYATEVSVDPLSTGTKYKVTIPALTIPATGHSWNSGVVTKEPTTKEEGVKTYTCTKCKATKTEAIAKKVADPTGTPTKTPEKVDPTGTPTKTPEKVDPTGTPAQVPVVKGEWKKDAKGWWFKKADGTYPANKWEMIDGKWYHFNKSGYMQTGWISDGGKWYYLENSGAMASSKWIGNYYVKSDGSMAINEWVDGNKYYVDGSGKWVPGKSQGSGSSSLGSAGWKKDKTGWWYQNSNGSYPKNCWAKIDGSWYHFNGSGYMQTGWLKDGGKWYYLKSSGAMATGWIKSGGKDYYMYSDGHMAANEWIGKYHVNASGVWDKTK